MNDYWWQRFHEDLRRTEGKPDSRRTVMSRINFDPGDPPDMEEDWISDVLAELHKHNTGRWKWDRIECSWTGKDADLEPTGHQGVGDVRADDRGVQATVLAMCCHAGTEVSFREDLPESATDKDYEDRVEGYLEQAYHIICGCGFDGEWDGDDWLTSYEGDVSVEWVVRDDGEVDIPATAVALLDVAEKSLAGWDKEMTYVSKELNRLAGWVVEEPGNDGT